MRVWDCFSKIQLRCFDYNKARINMMLLHEGMIVTGTSEGMIYFYDSDKEKVITKFKKKVAEGQPRTARYSLSY